MVKADNAGDFLDQIGRAHGHRVAMLGTSDGPDVVIPANDGEAERLQYRLLPIQRHIQSRRALPPANRVIGDSLAVDQGRLTCPRHHFGRGAAAICRGCKRRKDRGGVVEETRDQPRARSWLLRVAGQAPAPGPVRAMRSGREIGDLQQNVGGRFRTTRMFAPPMMPAMSCTPLVIGDDGHAGRQSIGSLPLSAAVTVFVPRSPCGPRPHRSASPDHRHGSAGPDRA